MKDATKYATDIAKKENDDALAAVKASGKTEIITLTPQEKAAMEEGAVAVHKENESRVGKETIEASTRKPASSPDGRAARSHDATAGRPRRSGVFVAGARRADARGRAMRMLKVLDRLEES